MGVSLSMESPKTFWSQTTLLDGSKIGKKIHTRRRLLPRIWRPKAQSALPSTVKRVVFLGVYGLHIFTPVVAGR